MKKKTVNYIAWGIAIVLIGILFFYLGGTPASEPIIVGGDIADVDSDSVIAESWIDIELTDVVTGEIFRISDFDKPIVMESFAVWCPTCKRQQDEIQKLIDSGDDSIHISVDTDPNEDSAKIVEHINRYGYTWSFVVFPAVATQLLIDDFGVGIVNAPGAPVILICPDKMARLLKSGVKSAGELREEIDKC